MFTENFLKEFKKFLKENLKEELQKFKFDAYLEALDVADCETASNSYELHSYETKSGHTECFDFSTSYRYFNENLEEVFEETETQNALYNQKTYFIKKGEK